jgi:hypothetical protein
MFFRVPQGAPLEKPVLDHYLHTFSEKQATVGLRLDRVLRVYRTPGAVIDPKLGILCDEYNVDTVLVQDRPTKVTLNLPDEAIKQLLLRRPDKYTEQMFW